MIEFLMKVLVAPGILAMLTVALMDVLDMVAAAWWMLGLCWLAWLIVTESIR